MIKWVLVIKDSVIVRSNLYIELPVSPYCPTARTRGGEEVMLSCRETLNLNGLMICQDFFFPVHSCGKKHDICLSFVTFCVDLRRISLQLESMELQLKPM